MLKTKEQIDIHCSLLKTTFAPVAHLKRVARAIRTLKRVNQLLLFCSQKLAIRTKNQRANSQPCKNDLNQHIKFDDSIFKLTEQLS